MGFAVGLAIISGVEAAVEYIEENADKRSPAARETEVLIKVVGITYPEGITAVARDEKSCLLPTSSHHSQKSVRSQRSSRSYATGDVETAEPHSSEADGECSQLSCSS